MLEYNRIDLSEGIDIKKCKETSRECSLCKFYYFFDKNFNYGPYLCNGCYDLSLKAISMKNLTIINHNGNHYRVNFAFISKKDAFNLIKNAVVMGKKRTFIYSSKQAISLDSVDLNKIVVSKKWKISDTTYNYIRGYLNNDTIQPICVVLPQMNRCIKYFDDSGKNMSFVMDDE